jgi:hypothetical protein
MILQLCTLLLSLFLFTGFGLPAAAWLRRGGGSALLLTPSLGVAALTLFATWLYLAGVSALAIGIAASILSLGSMALFRRTLGEALAGIARERMAALICFGVCLLLVAPILAGNPDFTITRGNPWDNFAYLKMSAVFAMRRYPEVAGATAADALANPLLANPAGLLTARPAINFLHAAISRLVPGSLAGGGYAFLCSLMIAGLLSFAGLLRDMAGRSGRPAASLALGLAGLYALGFWGQYQADIDAWSAVSATPLLLAAWLLVLRLLTVEDAGRRSTAPAPLALLLAGAVYLYPEGSLYHALILAGVILAAQVPGWRRPGRPELLILASVVLAILATVPFWRGTIGFVTGQALTATTEHVPWWQYFDAYLLGLDPEMNQSLVREAAAALTAMPTVPTEPIAWLTGPAGLLGVYFLTPGGGSWVVEAARLLALLAVFAGTGLGFVMAWRSRSRQYRLLLAGVGFGLLGAIVLAERGQAWAAGKALSYTAPLLCLVLLAPLLVPTLTATRARLAPLPWCLAQGWFAALALIGLGDPHGTRLPAPYPDWQGSETKGDGRWAIAAQMTRLRACPTVRVVAVDAFFRDFAAVALFEAGKAFIYDEADDAAPLPERCRLIQAGLPTYMPRSGPPSGVMAFPAGLMVPNLFFPGVSQEGWLGPRAETRLARPGGSDILHLIGEIPDFSSKITGGTMTITVDGTKVLQRPQSAGRFDLTVPLPRADGLRDIRFEMTGADQLPADGHLVSLRLRSIALESTTDPPDRP